MVETRSLEGADLGSFVFGVVVGGLLTMFAASATGRGILGAAGGKVERRLRR